MAYTFEEDGSYVECRRCEIIKPKITIKTKAEILKSTPVLPQGYWWRVLTSNLLLFAILGTPALALSLALLVFGMFYASFLLLCLSMAIVTLLSLATAENIGPVFTDRYLNIQYYKKKKKGWEKWWYETSKHANYLAYKKKLEENER